MGYYVDCIGSEVDIMGDMFKKAIELLSESKRDDIPNDIYEQGKMLCRLIEERDTCVRGWFHSYNTPLFVDVCNDSGKRLGCTVDLYKLIAPAVADGSWVAFVDEDRYIWRYKYLNGKCIEQPLNLRCEAAWC